MPLSDGLYKVTFSHPSSKSDDYGVLDLRGGRARGGDGGRAYVGTYSQLGSRFTAELSVSQHRHMPGVDTALGLTDVQVQLEGTCDAASAEVRGTSRDAPRVMFNARLALIAD